MLQLERFGIVSFPSGVKSTDFAENKLYGACVEVSRVPNSEELNGRLSVSDLATVCFPNALLAFCY